MHLSLFIKHNILTVFNLSEKTAIKRKADFFKKVFISIKEIILDWGERVYPKLGTRTTFILEGILVH